MSKTGNEAHAEESLRLAVERSHNRVTLILDVTAALITEVGIDNVTISEIVRRAGITPKLLWRYFHTRESIFTRLAQRHLERLRPTLTSFLEDFDLGSGFDGMIDASVAFSHWEPGYDEIWGGMHTVQGMGELDLKDLRVNAALIAERARLIMPHLSEREAQTISIMIARTCRTILRLALTENEIADDLIDELKLMVKAYLRERLGNLFSKRESSDP